MIMRKLRLRVATEKEVKKAYLRVREQYKPKFTGAKWTSRPLYLLVIGAMKAVGLKPPRSPSLEEILHPVDIYAGYTLFKGPPIPVGRVCGREALDLDGRLGSLEEQGSLLVNELNRQGTTLKGLYVCCLEMAKRIKALEAEVAGHVGEPITKEKTEEKRKVKQPLQEKA